MYYHMYLPLQFQPKSMVKTGTPFQLNKSASVRFGLLPRDDDSKGVRWFNFDTPTPGFTIFHTMAAWDDKQADSVVLFACRQDEFSLEVYGTFTHSLSLAHALPLPA